MKPAAQPWAKALFDGKSRTFGAELRIKPTSRRGQLWLELPGLGGKPQAFALNYFLGHGSLEQYLTLFPGGKIQTLPVAFDVKKGDWFDVFAGEKRKPTDWGYWANSGMTANSQCLFCHTTGYRKGYNQGKDVYNSAWSEIGVGCEACHGPGKDHELTPRSSKDPYLKGADSMPVPNNCAPCHSRRATIALGYQPGDNFLDYFEPELLETRVYFPDGQIDGEDYEWGSFAQSKMYRSGVTCIHCHDPHSAKLKAEGNALCLRCHKKRYGDREHTHHRSTSAGNACVSCHMPETVYMQRDPRRDHSFAVPDPTASKVLGVPNACSRCHTQKPLDWLVVHFDNWYPSSHFAQRRAAARAFKQAREGRAEAGALLVGIMRGSSDRVRRASAARLLASFAANSEVVDALVGTTTDADPLVRAAAARSLGESPLERARDRLWTLLTDPVRLVRIHAAFGLRETDLAKAKEPKLLGQVFGEWERAASAMAEFPVSQHNIGVFYTGRGEFSKAIAAYRRAVHLEPQAVAPRHNLAMLLARLGRRKEAVGEFAEILHLHPDSPASAFALGLLEGEAGRWQEAIDAFQQCLRYDPRYPRALYNLGLALAKVGKVAKAIEILKQASREPASEQSAALALSSIFTQLGRGDQAQRWADKARGAAADE